MAIGPLDAGVYFAGHASRTGGRELRASGGLSAVTPRRIRRLLAGVVFYTTLITPSLALAEDHGERTLAVGERAPGSGTQSLEAAGASISVDFQDADFRHGTAQLISWIERSADIVARYYGRFPTAQLRIRVSSTEGSRVRHGTAFGAPRPLIRIVVGRDVTAAKLREDWILIHEMTHLALPDVGGAHAWLSEGLATYVEGVARVQAGQRTPASVWGELARALPQGLPQPGDKGLDHTHTWGRTYWGGALFCVLADVEIRVRTDNRFGLQDALQAVLQSSGGLVVDWPIARVLATGDAAVGTAVLSDLYAQMKDAPVTPDLATLWRRLGIERNGAAVELRDDAPLAAVREAIMLGPRR
jgi:hypothetical protein